MFFMFSESALKNVKYLKQRCSVLILSGTSTDLGKIVSTIENMKKKFFKNSKNTIFTNRFMHILRFVEKSGLLLWVHESKLYRSSSLFGGLISDRYSAERFKFFLAGIFIYCCLFSQNCLIRKIRRPSFAAKACYGEKCTCCKLAYETDKFFSEKNWQFLARFRHLRWVHLNITQPCSEISCNTALSIQKYYTLKLGQNIQAFFQFVASVVFSS